MTERTNEQRADTAWHAICEATRHRGEQEEADSRDPDLVRAEMASALADFRHLCDRAGIAFAEVDKLAHQHYLEEIFL